MLDGRRGLGAAVLLCLVGAFVVLVGVGRVWTSVEVPTGPITAARQLSVPGTEVAAGVRALGLVGLAGVPALVATRRTGRLVVGGLLLLTGLGVVAAVVGADLPAAARDAGAEVGGQAADAVRETLWPWVTVTGGALLGLAGLLTALRGRGWPGLGQRYEAPTGQPAPTRTVEPAPEPAPELAQRGLWEALDRGEDPTGGADPQR